jgi:hypothetical protein
MFGGTHSDIAKVILSETHKGERNSQFGTCWITRNGENKKVKKSRLKEWLEQGWVTGRAGLPVRAGWHHSLETRAKISTAKRKSR